MIMKMRGDKCHPGRGKRVKIPLLPNNVGKKSANDAGPEQGHDKMVPVFRSSLYSYLPKKSSEYQTIDMLKQDENPLCICCSTQKSDIGTVV